MSGARAEAGIKVNLFLIGAQKCGTTALFRLLAQHPEISTSSEKEPSHFVDEEALAPAPQSSRKRWFHPDAYHALFKRHADIKYYAEGSTWYSMPPFAESVAHRILAYNPDAKFIYVLREPSRRVVSHYHMLYQHGYLALPIRDAVQQAPWLMNGNRYADVIEIYRGLFPKENLKIVISERFRADPVGEFSKVQEWLGLRPIEAPDLGSPQDNNVTPEAVGALRKVDIRTLNTWRRTKLWRGARRLAPSTLIKLGRRALYKQPIDKGDREMDQFRRELAPALSDGIARVRDLIDDPIPEWD